MNSKNIKRRKIGDFIRIMVLLVAFSVLLYPTVSNYLYEKNSTRVITDYENNSMQMEDAEKTSMLQEAQDYNQEMLSNIDLLDPFSVKQGSVNERYENLLNIDGNGMMGYIQIPSINVQLPIYHGTEERVLQSGVGHFEGTSLPVGGESTHAVLTGHRGLVSKKLFIDIDELEKGDVFYIKLLNKTLAYQVDQVLTVLPEETEELTIVPEKDYVTLVSCTPYGINTHRLLIRGKRIPYFEAVEVTPDQVKEVTLPMQVKVLIGAIIILIVFLAGYLIINKAAGKKRERRRRRNDSGKR